MHTSEKNFLERIASHIPGIKGYRAREDRRDTDKRLREYMASELDRHRKLLENFKRDLLGKGQLDPLDEADRVTRKLQLAADSIRHASYGYSGFFDQVKVQEGELDRLYQYDLELLGAVRGIEERAGALKPAADAAAALAELETTVEAFNTRVEGRKQLFNSPS